MPATRALFLMVVAIFGNEASESRSLIKRETEEDAEGKWGYSTRANASFVVAIVNENFLPFCTGALLSREFVLTAAHCVITLKIEVTKVIAGASSGDDFNSTKFDGPFQIRKVQGYFYHPGYEREQFAEGRYSIFNIAVIQVVPFVYNDNIGEIKLWNRFWRGTRLPYVSGKKCTAFSWGSVNYDGDFCVYELRSANVRARYGRLSCKCTTRKSWWEGHFFVCAGGRNNPGGICQRDSGGLLVCNDLLAAVHYSYQDETCEGRPKCDDRYTFSVYSYVCPVLGFIRQYIRSAPRMPRHCRMRYSHRLPWVTTIRPPWVTTVPPPPKPGQPGYPQPGQPGCPQPAPPGNPQPAPPGNPQPVPPANPKPGQPDPPPDHEEYEYDYDDRAVRSLNITTWLVVIIATITIFNVFPWQN